MNFYDIVVDLFGEPVNEMMAFVYYLMGFALLIILIRLAFSLIKAMFGIKY